MLVEKFDGGVIGGEPRSMQEEIVNFVGKNELFELDILFAQGFGEIDGFGEGDVAVVVALDEENGRAPGADGRKR